MPKESQYVKRFEMIGEARGQLLTARECLIQAVEVRMQDPVPATIRAVIEATTDLDELHLWIDVALDSRSLADLQNAMRADP